MVFILIKVNVMLFVWSSVHIRENVCKNNLMARNETLSLFNAKYITEINHILLAQLLYLHRSSSTSLKYLKQKSTRKTNI